MTTAPQAPQAPHPDWSHSVLDVANGGLGRDQSATPDEVAAFATALGMLRLSAVKASYRIDRLAGGAYRLKGRVVAGGEQACVVSLEPVAAHLDEAFDVEFWPDLPDADGGEDKAVLNERDVERLDNGVIPVGRIVFETLSAGLDPYPRKQGAEFSWIDKPATEPEKTSPFAALAKLKDMP
jgi:uncharacterized metal-binding protein YceD (DUF177 family)